MSGLRLGTHGLAPAEVERVRALMRRLAQLEDFSWRFVERAPFDALIVDDHDAARDPARPATRALISLDGAPRADRLAARLHGLEQEFTRADVPVLETPMPVPGPDGALAPPALHPLPAGRYRLRRWPPVAALRDDPRRVRMATLLARRSLTLAELANLSAQPGDACLRFVRSLESRGLIDVLDDVGLPMPPRPRRRAAFAHTVVDGLRRRLGWGGDAP
ncbi:MAG: hypothetical protein JSR41_22965 [Proteobacteria bacterium]|nr:hypothetical protein [Pseudomonadota bacterium]